MELWTGTETFAKEPKFEKLLQELKWTPTLKKPTGFSRMSITAICYSLGILLQDNTLMGAFSLCIVKYIIDTLTRAHSKLATVL